MNTHEHKINHNLIMGWLFIVGVLFVTYCGEVIKGERTVPYLIVFMLVTALPAFFCLYLYRRKPDMRELRYCIIVGYFLMYLFSMLTGSTSMVFSYILPLLSLLVLYHQPKLIIWTGLASMVVNVISIVMKFYRGEMTLATSKDAEIQIALLVLCFGGSYLATKLYDEITDQNISYLKVLDEKNNQIQKMTLQTISTIANTIDAKDEYTRGHSRRVAEYSVAIAKELQLSEDEVANIRSVALLHDIGKIGVPDSVLNKPGRLTQEEYQMMKQHTVIGGEILKDIGMIPGIDIGAKYHHERYDGKGYPDGLKGEEIPFIARIISVADAYDAMTSNRVYRMHLTEETVWQELNDSAGTQFDPKVVEAMLRLLKEKRLERVKPDAETEQELNDVARILSRVMEKREEKKAEKLLFDELTGVYNRASGEKLIKESMEQYKGCLMLFDLDRFRWINDTIGFVKGDIFLRVTAQCLREIGEDAIISRFGGDEFVVFFPGVVTEELVVQTAEKFLSVVRSNVEDWSGLEELSVSVGIAIYDQKIPFFKLLQRAEKALYFAKQQGGGRYYIHRNITQAMDKHLSRVDLDHLVQMIKNEKPYDKSMRLTYPEFDKIYEFIRNVANRNQQQIQILMFTLLNNEGAKASVEEKDHVMEILESAIIRSVRSIDMTIKYSSTQRIVLLMNLQQEQVQQTIEHIMKEFYKMYDKKEIGVYYDVADLSQTAE